jgi:hypothetical protein
LKLIDGTFAAGVFAERCRNGCFAVTIDLLDRRIARALLLSLWGLYACIGPGFTISNANSVSRIGLVLSIIEYRTLNIDAVADATIDKAPIGEHYYLDKAPGLSLMAPPAAVVVDAAARILGVTPIAMRHGRPTFFLVALTWAAIIFTSALCTAAAAAVLFLLARHLGASRGGALFGALGYGVCSPALGWATVYFGHDVAGACLFMGFAATLYASDQARAARPAAVCAGAAGALLAWSVVVDFPSASAALIIGAFGLWRLRGLAFARRVPLLITAVAAGAAALGPGGWRRC